MLLLFAFIFFVLNFLIFLVLKLNHLALLVFDLSLLFLGFGLEDFLFNCCLLALKL